MSDVADDLPEHLAFTYSEAEVWAIRKAAAAALDRGPSWDAFWFVVIGAIFGIGFAAFAAYHFGLVRRSELGPVLFTAYVAFIAGTLTYGITTHRRSRQLARHAYQAAGLGGNGWEVSFDRAGITCRNATFESRAPWSAVGGVADAGWAVMIWLDAMQALGIPSRAFRDAAAQADFVTAVAKRIKAARNTAAPSR